ncbi:MAG: thiamine pyrophosphate-binding protein [Alphaproteobacteria bacterium]|nr:thiamine pyrophosphate-binding protein [Alphaproteobacteria bacterium]
MNTSQVIAKYLAAAGIRHVFGYPGDPNIEFMEAARQDGFEFVLARREGTAGLMAEAYGMITGRPGVCMSTLGPGSSNLVNAVANAWLDRVPMIALSGQIEGKRAPVFTHQVLDHNRLFSPISKWATEIGPHTAGTIMRKALRVAIAERPGSVHITTPADVVGAAATDDRIVLPPLSVRPVGVQVAATDGVDADLGRRIKSARRPVVLAGISAQRADSTAALTRFADTVGCPVVVAPMAKGIIAEDHPYYAGTLDMACQGFMWDFLRTADLLLAVGFDAVELIKPWTLAVPTIHIDSTPNTDQIYTAEVELIGHIPDILEAANDAYAGAAKWSEAELRAHHARLSALYYEGRVAGRLNPTDVIDVVRRLLPREAVVSADVGSHKMLVGQGWTTYAPRGVLMTNGLSSMGFSLPAAMTAKLLDRARPVVCFIGDGGLAMVQGELRLAASLKLGMTVVVFCDNSLNRIELKQMARQYPSWGTVFEPTDMAKLGQSMGCDGIQVDDVRELERVIAAGPAADRPLVVGAVIDPAQYSAQF